VNFSPTTEIAPKNLRHFSEAVICCADFSSRAAFFFGRGRVLLGLGWSPVVVAGCAFDGGGVKLNARAGGVR
jgi:hypothetical protein